MSQSPSFEAKLNEYSNFSGGIYYLSLVGSLLYATQTHPDIQFSVNLITQFSRNSGIPHLEAAKHILYYLKGTQDFSLVLGHHGRCHDLAKQLSYYLYFFSFLFFSGFTTQGFFFIQQFITQGM